MKRNLEVILILFFIFLQNEFHMSDTATSMESQSHVRPKEYCEFYNETTCNESKSNGCSEQKEECETLDGKPSHCYVLWTEDYPGVNVTVKMKGCFTSTDCNGTRCVETVLEPEKDYLFCCCIGNMCNTDFVWEPKPKEITSSSEESKPVPKPSTSFYIYIVIILNLLVFGAIGGYFYLRRKKYIFNEVPTIEPNPIPQPSPSNVFRSITLVEVKAMGRFGAVWRAQFKGEDVAVKVFPVQDKQSWVQEQKIFKLPHMSHPNVLHYIGVDERANSLQTEFWLITAYHERGSLCDFLKAHTLTWPEMCQVVESMIRGLMHLHEENPTYFKPAIAHRDFKSKNVLLKSNMTACIADFGLALVFEMGKSCGDTHGQVGTRRYMAPEVLEGAINFTADAFLRIDMYACGLVLWELVSRCTAQECIMPEYSLPFEEEVGQHPSLEDMQEAVVQRKVRPTIPNVWRKNPGLIMMCETMEDCWDHDAEARLSASCVLERVLNQSKYYHSSLSMRIENDTPRSPNKENSL